MDDLGAGVDIKGLAQTKFTLGFRVRNMVSWSGKRDAKLGCFFVSGSSNFTIGRNGWQVGAVFKHTDGDRYAKMSQALCRPVASLGPPACLNDSVGLERVIDHPLSLTQERHAPLPVALKPTIAVFRTDNTTLEVRSRPKLWRGS